MTEALKPSELFGLRCSLATTARSQGEPLSKASLF